MSYDNKNLNTKHGSYSHGMYKTRIYDIWRNMKQRCYSNSYVRFYRYGGRGITVCDEWLNNPKAFMSWAISNGYTDELQIDRIDNDRGYHPSNCRFVSPATNSRNSSQTKLDWCKVSRMRLMYSTGKYNQTYIAKEFGISTSQAQRILRNERWITRE